MIKFFTSLKDWNHAAIEFVAMAVMIAILWALSLIWPSVGGWAWIVIAVMGFGFFCFYYGKEHGWYRRAGKSLAYSLSIWLWDDHDRNQTVYLPPVAIIMTAITWWLI